MNCDAAVIVSTDTFISLPSRSKDFAQSGIHHTVDKLCVLVKKWRRVYAVDPLFSN